MSAGDFTGSLQVLEKWPNARIFVSKLGRFAQADTVVPSFSIPQSLNRYTYVFNNPYRYVDPSGHCPQGSILLDAVYCVSISGSTSMTSYAQHDQIIYAPGTEPYPPGNIVFDLPIDEEDIDWIQWYGATEFAAQDKKKYDEDPEESYNYCGYAQCFHGGLDFGADWGTPVQAGMFGKVIYAANGVVIFVTSEGYQVIVQHLGSISENVTAGDVVTPWTQIGTVGNPSNNPSGGNNHIHIEIRYDADGDGVMDHIANPLQFVNNEQIQALQSIAASQVDRGDPSELPGVTLLFGDPLSQPDVIRGGPSLLP